MGLRSVDLVATIVEGATRQMKERRREPRATCRLHCRVANGREQVRARIVDISSGGLCLISPVWLKPKQEFPVSLDIPGTGLSQVRGEIWHIRREASRGSTGKVWVAGVSLVDADEAYGKLLVAAGLAPTADEVKPEADAAQVGAATAASTLPLAEPDPETSQTIDALEPRVFRLRLKARGGPRTRVLTMAAPDRHQAMKLAVEELGDAWAVLEVRET